MSRIFDIVYEKEICTFYSLVRQWDRFQSPRDSVVVGHFIFLRSRAVELKIYLSAIRVLSNLFIYVFDLSFQLFLSVFVNDKEP